MPPLKPNAFGLSLGLSLAVLSLLCWLAVLVFPQVPLAHAWLGLFSTEPAGSLVGGSTAIFASFVAGWLAAFVMANIYNRLTRSGA
jgi:hypothetical protein